MKKATKSKSKKTILTKYTSEYYEGQVAYLAAKKGENPFNPYLINTDQNSYWAEGWQNLEQKAT